MVGGGGRTILAVDDDVTVLASLRRGFELRGFRVLATRTAADAQGLATRERPQIAIIDLRIGDDWGLDLLARLKQEQPELVTVLLSGYLSVPSTVAAVRAGADHVLFKPISCSELLAHLDGKCLRTTQEEATPSLARAEWEHMMRVLGDCKGNISDAARRLGLHRQNLQRRLRKNAPRS